MCAHKQARASHELCVRARACVFAQFNGSIPSSIGQLTSLLLLDLGANNFIQLPKEISTLSLLTVLDVSQNQIGGTLPQALASLSKVTKKPKCLCHFSHYIIFVTFSR